VTLPLIVAALNQSRRPALADIIGARRVRTAVVISSGVDYLQVDRRGAEVGLPELALHDVERHALTRELERMRMAQLVRREAAPDPAAGGEPPELAADGGARPRPPAGSDRR
jgi:hypothetical protein